MGVDFAANASSKAIKESVDLSAAPDDSGSSITYTTAINTTTKQYEYTFNYTGAIQQITLPAGRYKLEVWGAKGGVYQSNFDAGLGGYSYGEIIFSAQQTLYVAVGGQGASQVNRQAPPATGGGWNGGGHVVSDYGAGGGGATHIATALRGSGANAGLLSQYSSYKTEVLMVAGGGGGNCHPTSDGTGTGTPLYRIGGGGGGFNGGQNGQDNHAGSSYTYSCYGLGGTVNTTAPNYGAGGGHRTQSGGHTNYGGTGDTQKGQALTNGSFGQGGTGNTWGGGGGGGGGGWYGGGGGCVNGGGGGSGYIQTGKFVASTYGGSKTGEAVREGNGLAKITDMTKYAEQSSIPTITINRHEGTTFTFKGTDATTSLLGTDPQGLDIFAHTQAVYQVNGLADTATQETLRARTWTDAEKADAMANSWLTYSFSPTDATNKTSIALKATRYWEGTKPFYVRVKNSHGTPSWFKFYASVEGGELKKDKTLPATMKNAELRIKGFLRSVRFALFGRNDIERLILQGAYDLPTLSSRGKRSEAERRGI